MYDQFLAKTFHTPNFGDEQFDANSQNNDDGGSGATQVRRASTERARGMTPSSDSSDERVQTPSHRLTPVSTGLSAGTETAPRHAPGYPPGFFGQQLTQEQLYNARLSYNQHLSYQQYKQQLVHQMGGYNPLEMLQQGYGMGPPAAPPRLPPPPVQTVPEPVEEPEDTAAQNQMYTGMKRPSPDNCFLNVQKKPKPQKKKKKRDPNEPQKPVSAYALFFRDTQAAIKGQNPNASFGEVSKIVASMWDTLDVEHKNVYKRKTEDAKKDYLKALAAYRASLVSKSGREAETTTTTTYNSGFNNTGGCYNGYSQHGYSPPTSVAGGGTEQHHGANQRAGHHHQGYSPPPGGMQAKMEHGNTHAPPMHHHGYSQTPGGGVVSDNRSNQLGHPFGQPASNQGPNMDHRLSHHHHGYSPTSGPTQQETTHSKGQQHNAYASSPGSASTQGGFNDNHAGSQDRNSQLGTHYHGYSPPRSISGENPHQMNAQYVTSGHPRLQTANTHQVYSNPGTSNISDNGQNNQQQSGGGYPGNMSDNHQNNMRTVTHHHPGYPQLTANSTQVDNRQTNSSQQTNQSHLGYSSSPGGGAQQETHQAGSQTTGYQPSNQSGETHHQLGSQNVSNAYTQASSNDRQHHASPQSGGYNTSGGDGHHHQHAATQSGGYTSAPSPSAESHHQHAASQSVSSGYPPTSTSEQHHQHHQRMVMAHQSYSATQTSPYNGYSPRLPSSFDGFTSNSPSAQSSQGQSHMNQDCVQSQQQQSQVLVGRHMAPPGGQHMTVHQPPPI